jgi:CheY-like chemotaxis protein
MRKTAALDGTGFLLDHARELVRQGVTTPDEVLRVVQVEEDDIIRCPQCGASIQSDFSSCPYCRHTLQRACGSCRQELKLEWKACPYCNTPVEDGAPGQIAAASPQPASSPGSRGTLPSGRARILVVDDDAMMHVAVGAALSGLERPPEIVKALDGIEALEEIARTVPDLVILDVTMPRLDGFAVCERLRQDLRTAFVPILMLTGNTDEGNRTKGFLVGTDDYMSKPFSVPELTARVNRLLRRTYGL